NRASCISLPSRPKRPQASPSQETGPPASASAGDFPITHPTSELLDCQRTLRRPFAENRKLETEHFSPSGLSSCHRFRHTLGPYLFSPGDNPFDGRLPTRKSLAHHPANFKSGFLPSAPTTRPIYDFIVQLPTFEQGVPIYRDARRRMPYAH